MHKVLIVSDSHGLKSELQTIMKRHHDVDLAIHCGDSELEEESTYLAGYKTVKGNCDWQTAAEDEIISDVDVFRFYVTHGHLTDVKKSLLALQYRAKEKQADIVCFGHSHIAYAAQIEDQLFINPGSIRMPRKFPEPSYVILSWNDKKELFVTFHHVNGEVLTSFPYENQYLLK